MNSYHQQGGGGSGTDGYNRPTSFSLLTESDELDHLRPSIEANIPLDDAEAWSEFAGRHFDIAVPSDEELEKDIMKGYVERSMNTPICDFRNLMHRLQHQISNNHHQRIREGKESLSQINDSIIEQFSSEDTLITHNDLDDQLIRIKPHPYSTKYLIEVDKIMDTFERGESFGTLQDNTKRQRQKAEDHDPPSTLLRKSGDKPENAIEIEMYDDQDDYARGQKAFVTSNKRPTSNPPQLSASMLAAAAKRRLKEVDLSENDANDSTPTIVISSVKSLAPHEVPSSISIASSQTGSILKGLVPILPKPASNAAAPASSTSTISQAAPSTSVSAQKIQQPFLVACSDGVLRLFNPANTVTSLGSGSQAPYKLLLRPSSDSNILNCSNVRPTGIIQLSQLGQLQTRPGTGRPLILASNGGTVRPIGIRNLTTISSGSRHILNSKLLPAKLVTQGSQSQGTSNKRLPEVPLQATPFRVNFESNDELSEMSEKFSSSTESGDSPAFSKTPSKKDSAGKDNSDKIIGF